MFAHQQFSRDLKIQKANYKEGGKVDAILIQKHLAALAATNLSLLKEENEKTAFWINIYNGLTNYWIITKKIKEKMTESPLLFFCAKVSIGGYFFSLDDIEHGILRNNRRSTYKLWKQFRGKDPRQKLVVKQLDYRIHFALNCGAKSCPPIAFYDDANLDKQLALAEQNFIEQEFLVDQKDKIINCSRIFWLYKIDFEGIYINDKQYKDYKIKYLTYNFNI